MNPDPLLCHYVNGKRYVATRGEPKHATLDSYRQCVRRAYGSLQGVTFGTWQAPSRKGVTA